MINNTDFFEKFLLDGGVNNPDCYIRSESEDFSPAGTVNAAYINRFADYRDFVPGYDMIA